MDEPSIEACMAKEASNFLEVGWKWKALDNYYFGLVDFQTPLSDLVPECYPLLHNEMRFFPTKHEIKLDAQLKYASRMRQT